MIRKNMQKDRKIETFKKRSSECFSLKNSKIYYNRRKYIDLIVW